MGRYFALTLGLPNQTAKTKPKKTVPIVQPNFGYWVFVLLIFLSVAYFTQVNGSSTKGYEINTLQRQLTQLRETSKRLELETASLKSIQYIEETVRNLNLVPSGKVRYVGEQDFALGR